MVEVDDEEIGLSVDFRMVIVAPRFQTAQQLGIRNRGVYFKEVDPIKFLNFSNLLHKTLQWLSNI